MILSDAARQIALVADQAKRTVVKARQPVRYETRRPGSKSVALVADPLAGDGNGGDAVLLRIELDRGLPRTSATADATANGREASTQLKVKTGTGDDAEEHVVRFSGGADDGTEATLPKIVATQITLLRGVDYVSLANTQRSTDQTNPVWVMGSDSGLDATQRKRLSDLDAGA